MQAINNNYMDMVKSVLFFLVAGLCEIGGGYLVWLWLKENRPTYYGVIGSLILILYGVVATYQPAGFGRAYATYGGIFVIMSFLWGWKVDGIIPDRFDIIGMGIVLIGIIFIMYVPRNQ